MKLETRRIAAGYAARLVLRELDLTIGSGEVVALIGPNGSGKTTLLRALGRLLRPRTGVVLLDGRPLAEWPTRALARDLALLPQGPTLTNDLSVEELVWMGRSPHQGLLGLPSAADREAVAWAMRETGVKDLAARAVSSLSGGERQRAWLAMALAQQPRVLLLDEPTTFLDMAHQLEVLDLVHYLNRAHGLTVVLVLHDLNQAARYADRVVVLRDGAVYCQGAPAEVVTPAMLREVFGVEGAFLTGEGGLPLVVVPLGRVAEAGAEPSLLANALASDTADSAWTSSKRYGLGGA
jgi:iron complex transport system ATP-binding protein